MLIDVVLPQLGESVAEGTISKWLVREGDSVQKDQPLASIATDKADSELPAPVGGRVAKLLAAEGAVVAVKAVIAQIEEGATGNASASLSAAPGAPVSLPPVLPPPPKVPDVAVPPQRTPMATPTVRRAALENDVDLERVQGTGERGRVTKDDVMRAAGTPAVPAGKERPSTPPPAIEPPPNRATPQTQQIAQLINNGGGFVPPIPGRGLRLVQGARLQARRRRQGRSRSRGVGASRPTT